jgi:hypothetical protein
VPGGERVICAENSGGLLHCALHGVAEGRGGRGARGIEECVDFGDGVEADVFWGGVVRRGGGVVGGDVVGGGTTLGCGVSVWIGMGGRRWTYEYDDVE